MENRVRELRHEKGLTLQALAGKAGVTYQWISKIERGVMKIENITLKNALALTRALTDTNDVTLLLK